MLADLDFSTVLLQADDLQMISSSSRTECCCNYYTGEQELTQDMAMVSLRPLSRDLLAQSLE